MSIPTVETFIERYPQFGAEPFYSLVATQLGISGALLAEDAWGDMHTEGVMLEAAHNLSLAGQLSLTDPSTALQLAAGPLSSVSIGGISTSFATASPGGKNASDDFYLKTVYGQQFLRLRRVSVPLGVMAA